MGDATHSPCPRVKIPYHFLICVMLVVTINTWLLTHCYFYLLNVSITINIILNHDWFPGLYFRYAASLYVFIDGEVRLWGHRRLGGFVYFQFVSQIVRNDTATPLGRQYLNRGEWLGREAGFRYACYVLWVRGVGLIRLHWVRLGKFGKGQM